MQNLERLYKFIIHSLTSKSKRKNLGGHNVGEEGTEHRLTQLEKAAEKTDIVLEKQTESINKIELSGVRQELILTIIMWSLKVIAGGFLTFVATNLYMYFKSK